MLTEQQQQPQSSRSSITFAASQLDEKSHAISIEGDHTLKSRPWRRQTTPWAHLVNAPYDGSGTEAEPYLIDWLTKGEDKQAYRDVENPMLYREKYKWTVVILAAMSTLAVSMASSMLSAALFDMEVDFPGQTLETYICITSAFVAGFVLGPFVWAPLSEIYGRRNLFIYTFAAFTLFNGLVCSSQSMQMAIGFRFLAGTFGASSMTNAGGVVADVFAARQRGLGMAVFSSAPFLGPAIGPVVGGFLGETKGWRWVAALLAFFSAFITILGFLFLPETFAPALLRQRAARMTKLTGRVYKSKADAMQPPNTKAVFSKALAMPWVLLFKEPIVALMALYLSVIYAILYMLFTAFPIVYQVERGWSPGVGGLPFVGIAIGNMGALAYIYFFENPRYTKKLAAAGGWLAPEQRLLTAIVGAILLPTGLFIFSWTCYPVRIHWIGSVIACVPFGMGLVLVFLGVLGYLVDSYLMFAASVLAGNTVVRSMFGVVFPLFTKYMFENLGVNWAATLISFLALAFVPAPIIFFMYGHKIRRATAFGRLADDVGLMMKSGMTPAEIQKAMAMGAAAKKQSADEVEASNAAEVELARAITTEDIERHDGNAQV